LSAIDDIIDSFNMSAPGTLSSSSTNVGSSKVSKVSPVLLEENKDSTVGVNVSLSVSTTTALLLRRLCVYANFSVDLQTSSPNPDNI
jgi:hypothetical protein